LLLPWKLVNEPVANNARLLLRLLLLPFFLPGGELAKEEVSPEPEETLPEEPALPAAEEETLPEEPALPAAEEETLPEEALPEEETQPLVLPGAPATIAMMKMMTSGSCLSSIEPKNPLSIGLKSMSSSITTAF
jgi:hypothetical protein